MININNLNDLNTYILDNEMYIRLTQGDTEFSEKPQGKQIANEHYKMSSKVITLTQFAQDLSKGKMFLAGSYVKSKEDNKIHYNRDCLKSSGMIIMDIDNGVYDIDDIHTFLKSNDIEPNLIYESFSYKKGNPRFRIIWVVGDMKNTEIVEDMSTLVYELLKKWSVIFKMQSTKTVTQIRKIKNPNSKIAKEEKALEDSKSEEEKYKNIILEEDKSSKNTVQMWQGTKNHVYLYHQRYVNISNFIDTFYSLASKGHEKRITDTLKKTCDIGSIGFIGNRTYKDISSNYYVMRDTIQQTTLTTSTLDDYYNDKISNLAIFGFKKDINEEVRVPKIEFSDEYYTNTNTSLLLTRCQLLRELQSERVHWIDENNHFTKFKILTNLKFIENGEELMYDTLCKHTDKNEDGMLKIFNKIKTNKPPVPCSEFCLYAKNCKYGRSSIAWASQENSYNDKKVQETVNIETITLDTAQEKVMSFVSDSLDVYKDRRELKEGWEYGNRRKYHHAGLDEIRVKIAENKEKVRELKKEIRSYLKSNKIPVFEINDLVIESKNIIKYIQIKKNDVKLVNKINNLVSEIKNTEKAMIEINQKAFDLRQKCDIISVPVGVGKTTSLIKILSEKCKNTDFINRNNFMTDVPHVLYASPSHRLAEQFEREFIEELKNIGMSQLQINSLKIVRLVKRPIVPSKKLEANLQNLEFMGMSVVKKVSEYKLRYEVELEKVNLSDFIREKYQEFVNECDAYIENRKNSKYANILITTHNYLEKAHVDSFHNIDVIVIDEDVCKTMTSSYSFSTDEILKMRDNLKKATYTYYDKEYTYSDLVDICDFLIKSNQDKFITYNSENYLCSEIQDIKGNEKVIEGIVYNKYTQLSKMRQNDKINYFKLCKIKSFIRHKNTVIINTFNELDCGNKPVILLSANPSPNQVLKNLLGRDELTHKETGYVEQQGTIKQFTNISCSRSDLENDSYINQVKELIKRENENCTEVITYKNYKEKFDEFNTEMHLGATSGLNSIKGKDLTVVGTYHLSALAINLFASMFEEDLTERDLELPSFRKVEYKGIEQKITTYSKGLLRDYHLWYIYDEMVQAEGRARAVRTDANVLIFCSLRHPQATVLFDSINVNKVKKTEEELNEQLEESYSKIDSNKLIDIDLIDETLEEEERLYYENLKNNEVFECTEEYDESLPF